MLGIGPHKMNCSHYLTRGNGEYVCLHINYAISFSRAQGRTLGACIGTLEPSLVANLDLKDVKIAVADRGRDQLMAAALVAIGSASEDLVLVVPEHPTETQVLLGGYHVKQRNVSTSTQRFCRQISTDNSKGSPNYLLSYVKLLHSCAELKCCCSNFWRKATHGLRRGRACMLTICPSCPLRSARPGGWPQTPCWQQSRPLTWSHLQQESVRMNHPGNRQGDAATIKRCYSHPVPAMHYAVASSSTGSFCWATLVKSCA